MHDLSQTTLIGDALSVRLGDTMVLDAVSLSLQSGRLYAVIGPNGAGKTTLLRTLAGRIIPMRGRVLLDGREVYRLSPQSRARAIAAIAASETHRDEPGMMQSLLTVAEAVALGRAPYAPWWSWFEQVDDRRAVAAAIERCDLAPYTDRRLSTLSSGEQARVGIAIALAQESEILLCDEPTARLDPRHAHETLALLRRLAHEGRSILVTLHDLSLAACYGDVLILLRDGRVVAQGAPQDVLTTEHLHALYDLPIEVRWDREGGILWTGVMQGGLNGRLAAPVNRRCG